MAKIKTDIQGTDTKIALYRKYRPTSLDQVVGQSQVTDILTAANKNHSFAHAYLFTGQRGTGKTTVARILAHLINGTPYSDNIDANDIDIIEIDAASNNSVDDVRELRDSVQLAPMKSSHKVYIIDEFHMLSKPAFNALLKTIEEPPEYVVFILATTELQKVPATILSRVQRFHFKPLPVELLAKHLRMIADKEKIDIDDEALLLVAKRGGGSVRDSITLLDQLSNCDGKIDKSKVEEVLGLISGQTLNDVLSMISNHQPKEVIKSIRNIIADGTSVDSLTSQLIDRLSEKAIETPRLYLLINQLLDVSKSALPEAKLLSVLVSSSLRQPAIAEAVAEPSELASSIRQSVSVASMVNEEAPTYHRETNKTSVAKVDDTRADNPIPKAGAEQKGSNSNSDPVPTSEATKATEPILAPIKPENSTDSVDNVVKSNDDQTTSSNNATSSIENFSWDDLLQQLQDKDRPSARSLLDQATYRYNQEANELTLFFAKAFHRKRAETERFKSTMVTTLTELYGTAPAVIISKDQAPADSDIASVLSVVGGEVTKVSDGTV